MIAANVTDMPFRQFLAEVEHGDLIAKMQDWPNADEWAERSRLFLPPHVQQAEKQDEEGEAESESSEEDNAEASN